MLQISPMLTGKPVWNLIQLVVRAVEIIHIVAGRHDYVTRLQRLFLTGTQLMKIFNSSRQSTLPVTAACQRMCSFQRTTVQSPPLRSVAATLPVSRRAILYRPDYHPHPWSYFPQDPCQFEPVHRPADPWSVYMGIPGNFSTPYLPDYPEYRESFCYKTMSNCSQIDWIALCFKWLFHIRVWTLWTLCGIFGLVPITLYTC